MADAVDDFLTGKTGGGASQPAAAKLDATDAFLTGGDATSTKTKAGEPELFRPETWRVPQDPAAQRIRDAAYQAFIRAPSRGEEPGNMSVLTTGAQDWVDRNLGTLVGAVPRLAGTVIGGVAATGAAGAATVNELLAASGMDPRLQRDLNMVAAVTPVATGGVNPLSYVPKVEAAGPKFAPGVRPVDPALLAQAEARGAVRNVLGEAEPPASPTGIEGVRPPPAGYVAPTPAAPVTADSPSAVSPTAAPSARITPIVTQAQAEAEADRIIRHFAGDQTPVINPAPLASGAKPTLSQSIEGGHGGLAGLERGVRDVPEQTQHFVTRETGNTALRNKAVTDVIGDSRATDVAEAELNDRTRPQEKAIFDPARTKPVDTSDAIAALDQILNGPQGQRDVVRSSLLQLRAKLIDKAGNMQTDAAQLRGVDLSIGDQISPKAAGTAHDGRAAAHELMAVRDVLRDNMEQGAPGYKDFLAQQAAERSAIDGQRFLQARNITDRQGNVNLGTLDSTIKAAESQQQKPGARLADGVTDEQLARLRELRADYQNDAKQRLGTSIGSPSVQKLGVSGSMGVMGHPLLAGGAGVAGLWAAGATNPLLGAVLGGAGYLMKQQSLKGQRMVMDALRDKLLNPERARSAFQKGG